MAIRGNIEIDSKEDAIGFIISLMESFDIELNELDY